MVKERELKTGMDERQSRMEMARQDDLFAPSNSLLSVGSFVKIDYCCYVLDLREPFVCSWIYPTIPYVCLTATLARRSSAQSSRFRPSYWHRAWNL